MYHFKGTVSHALTHNFWQIFALFNHLLLTLGPFLCSCPADISAATEVSFELERWTELVCFYTSRLSVSIAS